MDLSPLNLIAGKFEGAETLSGFDFNSAGPGQRLRGSARQFVKFYKKFFSEMVCTEAKITALSRLSSATTTQPLKTELRQIEKVMVNIITPGDKNEIDTVATDEHKREFFNQYSHFMNGNTGPVGTSVMDPSITFVPTGIATELVRLKCETVEQLSDATDEVLRLAGGPDAYTARDMAKLWVKANENDPTKQELNAVKSQLAEMQKQMSLLVNAQGQPLEIDSVEKKKPGRPALIRE